MSDITYSPSRISAFDDCKLRYKYYYIDKLESDTEGIEAFRGSMVHETLEEFYKLIKHGSVKPLAWVISQYEDAWNKNYTDTIKIVRKGVTATNYFEQGKKCLMDYYERYKPFHQTKIVNTEQGVNFKIRHDKDEYSFYGIMDRLDWNDRVNMFEIHDYKVTGRLMTQEEADTDWQLGLYHVALKKKWPDVKDVKLVWHSLLFNKEIVSARSEEQLEQLQKEVIEQIKKIESCNNFYPQKSALCDWCDFQNICPLWKHPKAMEVLPINEYKNDSGVQLVAKYAELEEKKNEHKEEIYEIEAEQTKIAQVAIEFAEKNKISIIDGPNARLKVDIKDELKAPTRKEDEMAWEGLRDFLIKEGKYNEVSTVNTNMLGYRLRYKKWPDDLLNKIKQFLKRQVSKTVKLIKK